MTKCPVCGSESQNNEEICKNCGSKLPKKKTEKTKSKRELPTRRGTTIEKKY